MMLDQPAPGPGAPTPADPLGGVRDFREAQYRREVFMRFYSFHLRYRAHPGGVYYVLPALARAGGWDADQRAWAAWINGNTQNPVTTAILMDASGNSHRGVDRMMALWRARFTDLAWDTDRRHHKGSFDKSTTRWLELVEAAGGPAAWWRGKTSEWGAAWRAAAALPHLGRLSTWSYLEYVRILDVADVPDADDLMLNDREGSKSHRNGLALVACMDEWIWWDRNKGFGGQYPRTVLNTLDRFGRQLLAEARARIGHPDVSYLTLESALCTYKSWHRRNRRYPNVYNDLLYDRILHAEARFGDRFGLLWDVRRDVLPAHLRLEDCPTDPGCVPVKQNFYLDHGIPPMMHLDWPCFAGGFERGVTAGEYGLRKR